MGYVDQEFHPNSLLNDKGKGTIAEFWQALESSKTTLTTYGSDVQGTVIGDQIPIGSVLETYVQGKKNRRALKKRLLEFLQKQYEELKEANKRENKEDRQMRLKLEKKNFDQPILPGIVSSFLYFGKFVFLGLNYNKFDIRFMA